jgi:gamma-glutamyltranspeptidase
VPESCTPPRAQVLSNMVDYDMEPQAALDAPRWRLDGVDSCVGPASVNDVTCVAAPLELLPQGGSNKAASSLR